MKIGRKDFSANHTYIMGILNVTPDSFSDGGQYQSIDFALKRTEEMIGEGADLIDIGGESTRPEAEAVLLQEELERVVPVVEAVSQRFDIPISVDTYKWQVAEASAKVGVNLVNDIWGFKKNPNMAEVVKKYDLACCLMHNREKKSYENFLSDVKKELQDSVEIALHAGISKDKIILDGGIGFAKSYEENLILMNQYEVLQELGFPILLGTSRKSMIGLTLNLPTEQRLEGTLATTVLAVTKGINFVRVHDIEANKRVIQMTEKILGRA